ncbi:MAG: RtcB family protein [Candidatus Altiarchaeota archaeon]|nr:RtcB family protein [Candidatus Altiarchaeota archaeon]
MKLDRTFKQAMNTASLESVESPVLVMPDGHEGYGFPIGGVAAFPQDNGLVSPGGIGYDINCGVRLLLTELTLDQIKPEISKLTDQMFLAVPSGLGSKSRLRLKKEELTEIAASGIKWAINKGYASKQDAQRTEEFGSMKADPGYLSERAVQRGLGQIGTLGAGNHFLEIQLVEKLFDIKIADAFGLEQGKIVIMVHTGSRGFGHQIASDYIKTMIAASKKQGIRLASKELAAARLDTDEAHRYLESMKCAVNFAFVNRQMISYRIGELFNKFFGTKLSLLYDVAHNIGKFEKHQGKKLFVHRKGATRAFGPGRTELPFEFSKTGQPVIIPGSMGTASYVMAGCGASQTFESSCHGAGRVLSRSAARKKLAGINIMKQLGQKGILVRSKSMKVLAEEAPMAYKDIDAVIDVIDKTGISSTVSRNTPISVVKG